MTTNGSYNPDYSEYYILKIYHADSGDLIGETYGATEQECIDAANREYNQDEYHWTNPVQLCKSDNL